MPSAESTPAGSAAQRLARTPRRTSFSSPLGRAEDSASPADGQAAATPGAASAEGEQGCGETPSGMHAALTPRAPRRFPYANDAASRCASSSVRAPSMRSSRPPWFQARTLPTSRSVCWRKAPPSIHTRHVRLPGDPEPGRAVHLDGRRRWCPGTMQLLEEPRVDRPRRLGDEHADAVARRRQAGVRPQTSATRAAAASADVVDEPGVRLAERRPGHDDAEAGEPARLARLDLQTRGRGPPGRDGREAVDEDDAQAVQPRRHRPRRCRPSRARSRRRARACAGASDAGAAPSRAAGRPPTRDRASAGTRARGRSRPARARDRDQARAPPVVGIELGAQPLERARET